MVESTKEKDETVNKEEEATVEDIEEDLNKDNKDRAAEKFVEIENDVRQSASTVLSDGEIKKGKVIDAERVDEEKVPDDYPVDIETDRSLVLVLEIDDQNTKVYLNWPDDNSPSSDSKIAKVLKLHGLEETEIANLHGKNVLAEVEEGYYKLHVPNKNIKGESSRGKLLASLGITYGFLVAGVGTAFISLSLSLILFTLGTLLAIPYYTYKDAWHLRTNSDWRGGPLFWATLGILPLFNIISSAFYFMYRSKASFI